MRSLGGTDDAFIAAYPEANTMRVSDLLEAIRGKHGRRRKTRSWSWNGTQEQRNNSPSSEPTTTSTTSTSSIEDTDGRT